MALAATFTAEPAAEALHRWLAELELPERVEVAPYHQLFQQLLDPASLLGRNRGGANVLLVRFEDWLRDRADARRAVGELPDLVDELAAALAAAAARSDAPWLAVVCPPSPAFADVAGRALADRLAAGLYGGVELARWEEVAALYPVAEVHDPYADEHGRVPYTPLFFAALGTFLARRLYARWTPPAKVIVLDCDGTLWQGACAETGALGVRIDPARRALQELVVARQREGTLLALCSKNEERDVLEVFARRAAEMPLRREHLVAWRVNWRRKSENLADLAAELDLGLDSFVFLDDDPVECAEVRAHCPQVLTLGLPAADAAIPRFLEHVWAFDRRPATPEDRRRTAMYREGLERRRERRRSTSFAEFLADLRLQISIAPARDAQLPRIAQLTRRTNQLNLTTLRRTESELRRLLETGEREIRAVGVRDRFGDYGLVGALLFAAAGDALEVDTFLLSCRALGRGVEHRMLAHLGELATARGLARVDVPCLPTRRNRPARDFLARVGAGLEQAREEGLLYRFPSAHAAAVAFTAREGEETAAAAPSPAAPEARQGASRSAFCERIATELDDARRILRWVESRRREGAAVEGPAAGASPEERLRIAVSRALGLAASGIDGGRPLVALGLDSLRALELRFHLARELGLEVPAAELVETSLDELAARLGGGAEAPGGAAALPAVKASLLSHGQQAIYFFHRLGAASAYNLPFAFRIVSAADPEALRRAARAVAARHAALRTTFHDEGGAPCQRVHPRARVAFSAFDARDWSDERLRRDLERRAREPFALETGPLLRLALWSRGPRDHVLLVAVHHIVSDLWSMEVFFRELGLFYARESGGPIRSLPPSPASYLDFVAEQRRWLASDAGARQLAFWRRRLAPPWPELALPTDQPRPAVQTWRGGRRGRLIERSRLDRLRSLARSRSVTLYTLLLAAFQALLHRLTGQREVRVGSPAAGRDHEPFAGVLGYFVNPLVWRARFPGAPSFADVLERLRRQVRAGLGHQEYPFPLLVEKLRPPRDPSRSPLFQVLFVLEQTRDEGARALAACVTGCSGVPMDLGGLALESLAFADRTAQLDLTLAAADLDEGLALALRFNADLFDAATPERWLRHYATLLDAVAARPAAAIGELPLLDAGERQQLLAEWSATAAVPAFECLHELFSAQARRRPEAAALSFRGRTLSYRELDLRADAVARELAALGVGPETRVGLCAGRSLELVIGLVGILKAGGAYVPLDPAYPPRRLAFLVRDAGIPVVVAEDRCPLPATAARVVRLAPGAPAPRRGLRPPASATAPGNAAYVTYTSGTTGRPKGVVVSHANVVRLLRAAEPWFRFGERDVWTFFHSFAFDFSVWEIWGALLYGGRLVVVPREVSRSPAELRDLLADEGVTVLNQTPTAFRQLDEADRQADGRTPLRPRLVIFGGEALSPAGLGPWLARRGTRLVNMYGITETTVHVTCRPLATADLSTPASPIGRPLADLAAYVLDRRLRPAPVGVAGELHVGGAGLARGYLGRPALTAEKLVPHPFGSGAGARLYRTGDRVRWRPDGELEYLGRVDHQVKVRGFRVEPGEIESTLERHPAVRAATVVAREDEAMPGHRRLVAYVAAPGDDGAALGRRLRAFLEERLPPHMVPAAFAVLERLPVTAHGKVDRAALARLEPLASAGGGQGPGDPAEGALTEIWSRILGLGRLGVHDNFFELGGDSILAIQIVAGAAREGLRLVPHDLFRYQTVAELAAAARRRAPAEPAADPGPAGGTVPPTPIVRWFFELDLPEPWHYNQARLLRARRPLETPLLAAAAGHLHRRHDALRLRCEPAGGGWRLVVDPGGQQAVPVPRIDLSRLDAVPAAIEAASSCLQASLDPGSALWRIAHFDLGGGEERLLLVFHHLAVDTVSWPILLEDLESAYRDTEAGRAVTLAPRTTSLQAWAEHLNAAADAPSIRGELDFWRRLPGRCPPLPLDFPAGRNTAASAASVAVRLDAETTRALLRDVPPVYRTRVDEVLATALVLAFGRWTGESSLLVDLEGHGREDVPGPRRTDLSRTVGWFTSIFPVLLEVGSPADRGAALKAVKESLRAVPRRGVGFGLLRYLSPDGTIRDALAGLARPAVSFNYQGRLDGAPAGPELLGPAAESPGRARGRRGLRRHAIEIDGGVRGGELAFEWTYSRDLHRRATLERLARSFVDELRALVDHCRSSRAGGVTPADFPLAGLTQAELDEIVAGDRGVEDVYPLSPMQRGLLFHTLVAPGSGVYVVQLTWELRGRLDAAALRAAGQRLVDRHAILRTGFVRELERPLQVVRRRLDLPWEEQDWRGPDGAPAAGVGERLAAFLAADRRRGFDPASAPLWRLTLLRLAGDVHRLVWSHHHLVLDGWSTELGIAELFANYEALSRGHEVAREPALPYRELVAWLARQDLAAAERFWRRRLAGFAAPTPLVMTADAAGGGPAGHDERRRELTPAASAALRGFARRHRLTLNTLVQGAWALVLGRCGGGDDVVYGTTFAVRPTELPGSDSAVGLFINTLPVRVRVAPENALLPWLAGIQRQLAEIRRMEHSPLVEVRKWSAVAPPRPLFESLLVFENYPATAPPAAAGELRVSARREVVRNHFPLTLLALPGKGLVLMARYDRPRYSAASAGRLLETLATVLAALVEDAGRALGDLPLLSAARRHQVLHEWSSPPAASAGVDRCLHELLEAQAARTPEAVALVFVDAALTYRELDARAGRLARRLQDLGVGPETVVGICLERRPEMVVAVLAVLKAGGAYLPMDAGHPPERLAFLLADSRAAVLLTRAWIAAALPPHGARVELVGPRTGADGPPGRAARADAGNAAYVVYTSGSSGAPKGVVVEHRQIAGYALAVTARLELGFGARFAMVQPLTVDSAKTSLFPPLLTGGCLLLVPEAEAADPQALRRAFERHPADVLKIAPSHLAALGDDDGWAGTLPRRRLVVGGEALRPDLAASWWNGGGGCRIDNHYGPTEATVGTLTYRLTEDPSREVASAVPLGRPLANAAAYLADARLRPVPAGVAGELLLGGACLARGYLSRVARTAESFVPHPWSDAAGRRLYRTGDLARHRADGVLEFLGRRDGQVKIRGFRVEPGEIEAVLRRHPKVREAAVLTCRGGDGEAQLRAVVAAAENGRPLGAELSGWLRERLPAHLVPAGFTVVASLPRTSHGKLDRGALRRDLSELDPGPAPARALTAPRTPVEEILAEIWAEVLGRPRVGVHDSFFELGGHSLLATQVVSRVRRVFRLELPVAAVFERPTVARMGEAVEALLENGPRLPTPRIGPMARDLEAAGRPLALSFAQERLWFLDRIEPGNAAYNMPAAFHLEGTLRVDALAAGFRELARRHDSFRTTFPSRDGRPRQAIAAAPGLRLPLADLGGLAPARRRREVRRLLDEEATRPFDLERGPLVRLCLLRYRRDEHVLLIDLHHIIFDGWSRGVLRRELGLLYEAFAAGRASPLAPLPVRYADFALWQRQWLAGEVLEAQLAYWRRQLAGLPAAGPPADRPRPAVPTFRGSAWSLRLGAALAGAFKRRVRGAGASLFMGLHAVFLAVLRHATRRDDLVVGSPVANRNREEIEGLIGFFVNNLVLRGDLSGNPIFGELLDRVRRTALAAYAHQDLPFEKLVQELEPARDLAIHPLFQVVFALHNVPRSEVTLPGLVVRETELRTRRARMDLELHFREENGDLHGLFLYSTDLFDATTIGRLAKHFETALAAAAALPEPRLAELPWLTPGELHQLLAEWNDTRAGDGGVGCFPRLFEDRAARVPEAVAVAFEPDGRAGERWTYRELDRRSLRLARRLRGLGVGPETRVALCLERSPLWVVGVVGVLRAGGAFVPLDPAYPAARLAFMLRDADAALVLTQRTLVPRLPASAARVICVDGGETAGPEAGFAAPDPDHLAYVIYTSGSTGKPKGVMVTHRGLANLTREPTHRPDPDDAMLQYASASFDASIAETLPTLTAGATLHLVDAATPVAGAALADLIRRRRVTRAVLTPSVLATLPEGSEWRLPALRTLLVAGEACPGEVAARWARAARSTGRLWINAYGPTEASVCATAGEVGDGHPRPPIGRPIVNARVYVLDARLRPVAVGVAGELHVGGTGLARGYLGRPRRTAERFVPDPFASRPGERLYRTGDRARTLADGRLDFLGRLDRQVKVRGFRIEPEEIEAALRQHPAVREAVVAARGDPARLTAYLVPEAATGRTADGARLALWRTLFDDLHGAVAPRRAPSFAGWTSSYTGRPIPTREMREWLAQTVERVLASRPAGPGRVLEIGCGTGLLVSRLAPHADDYLATDFSEPALEIVRAWLATHPRPPRVRLARQAADDFRGIDAGAFDLVVLSSVVQYFPSVDYLLEVLCGAVRAAAPGGRVFVGDVRSLPLLDAWCASVEMARAAPSLPLAELRERVRRRRRSEEELALDPGFFPALRRELPRVRNVRIRPREGRFRNELNLFRYDVVLELDDDVAAGGEVVWLDWRRDSLTPAAVRAWLDRRRPSALGLRRVPDPRLSRELAALAARPDDGLTVGDLAARERAGLAPRTAAALVRDLPYRVEPSLLAADADGAYSLLFARTPDAPSGRGVLPAALWAPLLEAVAARPPRPWSAYANTPRSAGAHRSLLPELRAHLRERLPDHMMPAVFVTLDALPRTPSGKVDRRALPAPGRDRPDLDERPVTPQTATERRLAAIWCEVLGLRSLGVRDNFFELGGDSLMSIQIVARAQNEGLRLAVKDLFQHQTVAALARRIDGRRPGASGVLGEAP